MKPRASPSTLTATDSPSLSHWNWIRSGRELLREELGSATLSGAGGGRSCGRVLMSLRTACRLESQQSADGLRPFGTVRYNQTESPSSSTIARRRDVG